jgi:hypothetical protein
MLRNRFAQERPEAGTDGTGTTGAPTTGKGSTGKESGVIISLRSM